ncbi:MAG: glycosyltransferase family 2 protein [Bacteroidetes bacterium]|nr:glycosyltransferase family 2 protein [Bacteroidota bacterium]
MKVAVVILNWNGKSFLEKFLPGVIRHSRDAADIIVADNHSSDDSVSFLKERFPEVKIIINQKNYGFAGGYNEALKHVDADYYVLLNSDVEVTEHWIRPVVELMENNKNVAACQPKIRSYKNRNEFEYAGAAGGFIDKYGYPFCRGRIFTSLETDHHQYDEAIEIFWATGACMFVRAESFRLAGGFDDSFFAHMEEIDLCWRFHRLGYSVMCSPSSVVYHVGGGTLPKNNPRKTYLNFRNNLLMIYKNAERKNLFSILLFRTVFDMVAAIIFLFSSGWKDFKAVVQAHIDFHRKKKHLDCGDHPSQLNRTSELIYPKSILFGYFIFNKKKFPDLRHYSINQK